MGHPPTTLQKAFIPLPSGGQAVYSGATLAYYRHADWMGSSRLATTPSRTVYFDGAYAPFGESYSTTGTTDLMFGDQTQDVVAGGLYDTPNRKYSAQQGRWTSPDPSGLNAADPTNPQSWNRYAYVLNNPLGYIDPDGLDCIYVNDDSSVGVLRGDCISENDNGYYVNGTVDTSSFVYNSDTQNLGYNYTNDDTGAFGHGVIAGLDFSNGSNSSPEIDPFGQAVLGRVVQNFQGTKAFQNCKAQKTGSFNNNWFIKNFSLASALRDPTPFTKTAAEALLVKGGGTALAYGAGGAFKAVGTAFTNAGAPIRGGSYFFTGEAIQAATLSGVKALGAAGTAATVGATAADLGYNLHASYACRSYLSAD